LACAITNVWPVIRPSSFSIWREDRQGKRGPPRMLDLEGSNSSGPHAFNLFVFLSPEAQLCAKCVLNNCENCQVFIGHGSTRHDFISPACISTAFSKDDFVLEGESSNTIRISPWYKKVAPEVSWVASTPTEVHFFAAAGLLTYPGLLQLPMNLVHLAWNGRMATWLLAPQIETACSHANTLRQYHRTSCPLIVLEREFSEF
jgi:hypothetical protein